MALEGKPLFVILMAVAMATGCGKDYEPVGGPETPPENKVPDATGESAAVDTQAPLPSDPAPATQTATPQPRNWADISVMAPIPDVTAAPGDRVVIPVQITGGEGGVIAGVDVRLTYPVELLEPKGVVAGPVLQDYQLATNISAPGRVNIVATKVQGAGPIPNDAHLADVVFQVKSDAASGATGQFTYMRFDIAQPNLQLFRIDREDTGALTIQAR